MRVLQVRRAAVLTLGLLEPATLTEHAAAVAAVLSDDDRDMRKSAVGSTLTHRPVPTRASAHKHKHMHGTRALAVTERLCMPAAGTHAGPPRAGGAG